MISPLKIKKAYRGRQAGFTLIEMLVYLGIFLIVSTASVTFLLSLNGFIDQYRLEAMLYRSGTNALEQILVTTRQADSIDLLNTTEDSPFAGKLTLENIATSTTFELDGGELEMTINGTEYGNLLSNGVTINAFTVYHYDMDVGDLVRVRLDLTATLDAATTKSITLYGAAMVRGSI